MTDRPGGYIAVPARSPVELTSIRDEITTYLTRAPQLALPLVAVAGSRAIQMADLSNATLNATEGFGHQIAPEATTALGGELATAARMSEMFYVATPMARLVFSAAESLEETPIDQTDFLAPYGLMYFAEGVGQRPCPMAIMWAAGPTDCTVAWLSAWDRPTTAADRETIAQGWGVNPHLLTRYVWQGSYAEIGGAVGGDRSFDAGVGMIEWLLTVFYLMRQRLVITAEPDLTRSDRKRAARSNADLMKTRVITLRTFHRDTAGEDEGREYLHQWVVRGHWRKQWYPTEKIHRPIWIAPHIKGPDGAPLLGTDKVYSLQR